MPIRYLGGRVFDPQQGMSDVLRMTAESTLKRFGITFASYSIDRRVIDDQADLLIPRAVAYSTGLLNYYFRGRIGTIVRDERLQTTLIIGDQRIQGSGSRNTRR